MGSVLPPGTPPQILLRSPQQVQAQMQQMPSQAQLQQSAMRAQLQHNSQQAHLRAATLSQQQALAQNRLQQPIVVSSPTIPDVVSSNISTENNEVIVTSLTSATSETLMQSASQNQVSARQQVLSATPAQLSQ